MQTLNVQMLKPQVEAKNSSPKSERHTSKASFRDMVDSMSQENTSRKTNCENPSKKAERVSCKTENENCSPRTEGVDDKKADLGFRKNLNPKAKINIDEMLECGQESNVLESQNAILAAVQPQQYAAENCAPENTVITESEFTYLKNTESRQSAFDMLIENATEYSGDEQLSEIVSQAQNLSVDEPEKFLEMAAEKDLLLDGERKVSLDMEDVGISEIDTSDVEESENAGLVFMDSTPRNLGAASDADFRGKKDSEFKLEAIDSKTGEAVDFKSFVENRFNVVDERSAVQKKSDFEEMMADSDTSGENPSLDLQLSLKNTSTQNILSSNSQSAGAQGSVFEHMLSEQIANNAGDIVKAGTIVLKDNDTGSINMILKPESLGNVKVSLKLTDNVISGQIVVHSKEAFDAFKQNMDTLRQAFQDSGFNNAELTLSYQDSSSNQAFAQNQQKSGEQFLSNQVYGDYASDENSRGVDAVNSSTVFDSVSDKRISVVA